ncbi:hypothetical protein [Peribacillus butanolivorans]|uniref:hypothetical protein n=1 Tax=Peribacillus butanolivorans TaxID=421767 RepID=UPI0011457338|nr:hypothetical protein [Peribacillus butanolivorans]
MEIHSAFQEKRNRVLDVPVSRGTFGAERNFDCNSRWRSRSTGKSQTSVGGNEWQNNHLVGPISAGKAIKAINQMLTGHEKHFDGRDHVINTLFPTILQSCMHYSTQLSLTINNRRRVTNSIVPAHKEIWIYIRSNLPDET